MAKKKAKPSEPKSATLSYRCNAEYLAWLDGFIAAKHLHSYTAAIDQALMLLAMDRDYPAPPKRWVRKGKRDR